VGLHAEFETLLHDIEVACRRHYGERLVSVAVFGSLGRGTPRPDSDVDLLIVAHPLPDGRLARVDDFRQVEAALEPRRLAMRRVGLHCALSPVFKTPDEIRSGSPLLFDMTSDARCLYDRGAFLTGALAALSARLQSLGARRMWRGNAWVWDLKPDFKPGEVFEL
jgi:predicted nucleotidyltransferase